MDTAQVRVDFNRLGRSNAGLVFAGLCVQVGEACFPDREWTDFVVVVLSWWADAFEQLLRGDRSRVQARFMEGPFLMEIQNAGTGFWLMQLVEEGLERRVRGEKVIPIVPLVSSCADVCESVLDACRDHEWWSSDAHALSTAAAKLSEALKCLVS